MSDLIEAIIIGDAQLVAKFTELPGKVREELRRGIGIAALRIQRQVMENKLSGQVLKVRTGRLRRSINVKQQETTYDVSATVGTNVEYARAHEFGFDGVVSVREHLRRAKNSSRFNLSLVRAHTMHMNLPERSFLRSALRDMLPEITKDIEDAKDRALQSVRS